MHFPSSRKVMFIFSVLLELHSVTVSRCERGTGRGGGACGVEKGKGHSGTEDGSRSGRNRHNCY